jgi:hypothetical protein
MAILTEDVVGGRGYAYGGDNNGLAAITPLLLLSMLGGGGLFGGRNKDCVDQSALNGLQASFDTNAILAKLGGIEAAIPYNEAQVQLALAGAIAGLTQQNTNNTQHLSDNLGQIQLGQLVQSNALQSAICNSTASLTAGLTAVDTNIDRSTSALQAGLCAVNTNVDRTAATIINTIRDDGNATRALITDNVIQGLRDDKVILANELAELRSERNRDRDRHGVEVTMINNQTQAQLQFQEQRQQMNLLTNHLFGLGNQIARAANSNVVVGSTGVANTQSANPTNVAA